MNKGSIKATIITLMIGIPIMIWSASLNREESGDVSVKAVPDRLIVPKAEIWRVTAYCPCEKCCGEFADGITANGHVIKEGDVFLAAPPEIPFGTMVVIPGYNDGEPVEVLDRGGVIKGNRLDVYFDTHEEALEWGVQYLEVEL